MYIASLPFYPIDKRTYDIEEISAEQRVMMDLYPEIYSCVGCNACTKGCPQDLNVMQYIAYAQRGDFKNAQKSPSTASAAESVHPAVRPESPIRW